MPMVYVSKETMNLIERITSHFRENTSAPSRILKTDVVHAALDDYAKKLGVK